MRLLCAVMLAGLSVLVQAQAEAEAKANVTVQAVVASPVAAANGVKQACPAMFNTDMRLLHSDKSVNLCDVVQGHPVLVVNTASHCGFTPQFKGLEKLHQAYKDKGLVVIGFASDDFYQEANSEAEAATICYVNFGVSFTMVSPSHVRGDKANSVFAAINAQSSSPSWNFNKYLVDANGKVVAHFGSRVVPDDAKVLAAIDALLSAPQE